VFNGNYLKVIERLLNLTMAYAQQENVKTTVYQYHSFAKLKKKYSNTNGI